MNLRRHQPRQINPHDSDAEILSQWVVEEAREPTRNIQVTSRKLGLIEVRSRKYFLLVKMAMLQDCIFGLFLQKMSLHSDSNWKSMLQLELEEINKQNRYIIWTRNHWLNSEFSYDGFRRIIYTKVLGPWLNLTILIPRWLITANWKPQVHFDNLRNEKAFAGGSHGLHSCIANQLAENNAKKCNILL